MRRRHSAERMRALQQFVEAYVVPLQLVLALLGMGATLAPRDFVPVARDVRGVLLGLALSLIFVPCLAVLFIHAFDLTPGWAVGWMLISVVPCGVFANLLTHIGRGNVPLAVAVTAVSTVACPLSVPFLLKLMVGSYLPPGFAMPLSQIVRDIALYLLLPLLAGMALLQLAPKPARVVAVWSLRVATWLILLVVFSSLGSRRIDLVAYGWGPPLLLSAFGTCIGVLTPLLCRLCGRYDEDTVALSIVVEIRNVGLALLLARFFFQGGPEQAEVLYSCLFYAGMHPFMALPIALLHRAGRSALLLLPRRARNAVTAQG